MNFSDDNFQFWSQGPSATESVKCENAESVVRKAISADDELARMDISVFAQGSYRARTNVREDSDVDLCVRLNSTFFPKYPKDTTKETFGNTDGSITYAAFKDKVGRALFARFGKEGVTRGNKAFDVHANTYRIDADVVPTLEHRRYTGNRNADGSWQYYSGVAFNPDSGGHVINWPDHNYDNGVAKNDATQRHFKRVVRIFKRLRYMMQAEGMQVAETTPSFLIECLVYNAPQATLQNSTYLEDVKQVILSVWQATETDDLCSKWVEVNGMKWLFRDTQPWNRIAVRGFMKELWNYIGY